MWERRDSLVEEGSYSFGRRECVGRRRALICKPKAFFRIGRPFTTLPLIWVVKYNMLYSPLDIHKISGVLFVEAKAERRVLALLQVRPDRPEVTVSAGSQSLDAAFLLRTPGGKSGPNQGSSSEVCEEVVGPSPIPTRVVRDATDEVIA